MNSKGQTLVIFVIILPILLVVLTLVIDLGLLHIEERKIENNVLSASEYYLNNITNIDIESKTKELLNKNLKDIKLNITDKDNYVEIKVVKETNSLYNIISNNKLIIIYNIDKENKKIIKG